MIRLKAPTTRTKADARSQRSGAEAETGKGTRGNTKGTIARAEHLERGLAVTDKDRMAWQNRRNPF